jgi:putative membrane protein
MKKASRFFSDAERELVEEAVALAELRTSGEIVPVVATSSGRYDRAEDLFGVLVALVALAGSWLLFQEFSVAEGDWGQRLELTLGPLQLVPIVLVGFVVGAILATLVPELRLPFIGRGEMEAEVERAARAAFQELRVRGTAGGTGVLIYLSLFERMVHVLGDEAISAQVEQERWQEVCDTVVAGVKNRRPAQGLGEGILSCGELLAEHFPVEPGDRDELANALHILD